MEELAQIEAEMKELQKQSYQPGKRQTAKMIDKRHKRMDVLHKNSLAVRKRITKEIAEKHPLTFTVKCSRYRTHRPNYGNYSSFEKAKEARLAHITCAACIECDETEELGFDVAISLDVRPGKNCQ